VAALPLNLSGAGGLTAAPAQAEARGAPRRRRSPIGDSFEISHQAAAWRWRWGQMNGGLAGWLGGLVGLAILVLWLYAPILWAALGSVLLVTGFIIVVRQLLD
jgi:hypothetical protein